MQHSITTTLGPIISHNQADLEWLHRIPQLVYLLAAAETVAPLALADPPDWVVLLGAGGTGGALRFLEPEALELLGTCPGIQNIQMNQNR